MRKILPLIAAFTTLALPAAAQACRVHIPLETRLEGWHERGTLAAIVVVEVTETRTLEDPWGDTQVYAKSGTVLAARGDLAPGDRFTFSDELLISSCNWQNNVEAQVGDRLAVYLTQRGSNETEVFMTLELERATTLDPEIRKLMRAHPQVWPIRP